VRADATAEPITSESTPPLSVVVPTSTGGLQLDACLDSLAAERYPGLEVVVVDNATVPPVSVDPSRPAAARVIRNEVNTGFAEGCNQGLHAASGELVLLLNDDATVEPGALRALVDALEAHPSWGACQAKLLLMDDPSRLDTAGSFLTSTGFLVHRGAFGPEARFSESDEIFAAKGAALLLRASAAEQVGGFDEDFFAYFEDSDLCWRLWLAGWEVGFAADARVLHGLGSTAASLDPAVVQFHSFKNRICTLLKNLGGARLAWMLPLHLALCLGLSLWYPARGERRIGGAILRAIGWNVRHLPSTLRKRRRIQSGRAMSDRVLMPRICVRTPLRTLLSYARGDAEVTEARDPASRAGR
jgi:GT2 family glycosyltransferase